ncbi:MAG: tetratricopeptide repeat protein [Planctomycetota bacterium]
MAQKRVNKNLVAFLTIMGILLMVVVVAIATSHGAGKDPEEWARRAREQEAAGDFEFAIRLFDRAYRASQGSPTGRDVSYLVEQAMCGYRYGEIRLALNTLIKAHAEQPSNREAIVAYLDVAWDLYQLEVYWRLDPTLRGIILEFAQALWEIDDQDVLGSISETVARLSAEDAEGQGLQAETPGQTALAQAIELDEHNLHVVLTRLRRGLRQMQLKVQAAQEQGALESELRTLTREYRDFSDTILTAAVAANPGEWRLVETQISELRSAQRWEEALTLLERTVELQDELPKPHLGLAEFLLDEALRTRAEVTAEEYDELLNEAAAHARRAIALEPAMYDAYVILAQSELRRGMRDDTTRSVPPENYEKALGIYDEAIRKTVGVHSLEAALGERYRRLMYIRAFNTALTYYVGSDTPEQRAERLEWVHAMLEPSEVRYPEEAFTYYMRGQAYLIAEDQLLLAIRAFEKAEQGASTDSLNLYPRMWFDGFNGVLPLERLALLYRQHNQPGIALDYTERAMGRYLSLARGGMPVNRVSLLNLALNRAELLNALGRPQDAHDFIVADIRRQPLYTETLAENESFQLRLSAAEASALQMLGQGAQAAQVLSDIGGDSVAAQLLQANLAVVEGNFEEAQQRLQAILTREDVTALQTARSLRLLIPLLINADEQAAAGAILSDLRGRLGDNQDLNRVLRQYEIILSYEDLDERRAKWVEMLAAEPDPLARANALFEYYISQQEYERAAEFLDELERAQPEDLGILERQFRLRLRLKDYDRATEYCRRLGKADGDHAGGAIFRGELAMAQGNAADAIREFREALTKLPRTCSLQVALARALLGANRANEAVVALEEAVQLNPQHFDANKFLYLAYQLLPADRRPADEGIAYLRKAAELRPQDPFVKQRADFLNPPAAIKRREEARGAEPDNLDNLIMLARLYIAEDDEARATERLKEALAVDPSSGLLAQEAADFYARSGQREAGEEHLRKFLETLDGRARADGLVLLARFYTRLNDVSGAESAYQDARQVVEETVTDSEERRIDILKLNFEVIELYQRFEGREKELVDICREVLLKLDPKRPGDVALIQSARFAAIQAKLRLELLGEADEDLTAYRTDYPDDLRGLISQAQIKIARLRWDEAYRALSDVLVKAPDHLWSLLNRGNLLSRFGRYTEAKDDLMRAKSLLDARGVQRTEGTNEQLYLSVCLSLASLYETTEQYELAEAELRNMLKLVEGTPGGEQTVQQIADRLVLLNQRSNRPEKAQQVISEFMAREPGSPYWPFRFGLVCIGRGDELMHLADTARADGRASDTEKYNQESLRQYRNAVTYLQQAQQLAGQQNPMFAWRALAFQLDALAAAGQPAQAVEIFERRGSQVEVIPAIASASVIRAYEALDRRDDALRHFENAIETASHEDASVVSSVVGLGRVQLPREIVLETLQRVAERTPTETVEGLRLRNVLVAQFLGYGRVAEGTRLIEQVLTLVEPGSNEHFMALLLSSQAASLNKDVAGAVVLLEGGLEIYPNNASLLNNLAYMLADQLDRPTEALKYAERACQLDARNASFQDTLGWVYFKNKNYDYAEAALKLALAITPNNPAANLHLGLLCADRGRNLEARTALTRALDLARQESNENYARQAQEALDQLP